MEIRSWNSELCISNILFKRVFSNIQIERTDNNGNTKLITVNCQFGQRSRIFKSWQNAERRANIRLPMIVINRSGYQRDAQRLNSLHNEVKYEITSKNRLYDFLTPVPISISYEVTVIAKNPSDIDQIASNFMVFFNSSIYVSCVHPKYDGIKMNNQVIMEDSINEEHPDEFDGTQDDFITSTFNFTFKTYLFGGTIQSHKTHTQTISSFISSFISSDVVVIMPDQIDDFQKMYPNKEVSATLTNEVTAELTTLVDDPTISDDIYDFIPIIQKIDIGFYPTPTMSNHIEYMKNVDTNYKDLTYNAIGYISSTSYTSSYSTYRDDEGNIQSVLTALTPDDMIYEFIDAYETIAPYKDRLYWRIDGALAHQFPDNVAVYRKYQLK